MNDENDHYGWWNEIKRSAWIRDKCRCVYCGLDGLKSREAWCLMQTDHLVPQSYFEKNPDDQICDASCTCGASTSKKDYFWNLVVACKECNESYKKRFNPNDGARLPERLCEDWHLQMKASAKKVDRRAKTNKSELLDEAV